MSLAVFTARDAAAQSADGANRADARAAYDGAALAYARGDFLVAAREFARADELDPNDVALAQALESATRAGSASMGMNLVERTHARTVSPDVQSRANEATDALAPLASKIIISCDECDLTEVDNVPAHQMIWVEPGAHVVEMHRGQHVDRIEVHATAGSTFEATPPPIVEQPPSQTRNSPPSSTPTPLTKEESKSGWSPLVFWGATAATTILGAVTIGSAVDTMNKRVAFEGNPSTTTADAGHSAETRTNVFLGVTAAAAISSAVIGIVFVDWSSAKKTSDVGLSISPSALMLGGHFQ